MVFISRFLFLVDEGFLVFSLYLYIAMNMQRVAYLRVRWPEIYISILQSI